MGLGDVKGATDRDEGVILSRSLEDVADGVRFAYTVRPSLGGRIGVTDDVGEAVSVTIDGEPAPEDVALSAGTVEFELPIEAGDRKEVALIAHDVAIEDLSVAEPTVDRLESTADEAERPTGLFGRLGGLLGGSGPSGDQSEPDSPTTDSRDPLDVAALEALSDDVPETPADVIEGAPEDSEPATADDGGSPLEEAVEDAVTGTPDPAAERPKDAPAANDDPENAADRSADAPTLGESPEDATTESDDAIDLTVPDPPAESPEDGPAPSVPEREDSVLADLVTELEGEEAAAHRAALREALGLSGVTATEIDAMRERQLAIRDALEDLRTQARETRQTQSTLEDQLAEAEDVLEAIRDEVSTLHRGCSVLEEEFTGFGDRLEALEASTEDVAALRDALDRAESQREQLTEGIKAVDDRVDDLGDQKARLQDRLDRLEATTQDLEAFRSSLARALGDGGGAGPGGSRDGGPGRS